MLSAVSASDIGWLLISNINLRLSWNPLDCLSISFHYDSGRNEILRDENAMSSADDNREQGAAAQFLRQFASACEGSGGQRAELINSFRDYLRAVAVREIGNEGNGKLSVSDLVQEAIIDACDGIEQCRATGEEEFKAWLRKILVNDISNRYRYLRRKKRDIGKEISSDVDLTPPQDWNSPILEALRKEEQRELAKAIEKLSSEHQLVIRRWGNVRFDVTDYCCNSLDN